MPSIIEQLAVRTQLQALEKEFVSGNKRHVTARTDRGSFTWSLPGHMGKPAEVIDGDIFRAVEDMIVAQRWDDIMVATERGTFTWEPR